MKEHINRWIFASCSKFLSDKRGTVKLYIEGQDRSVTEEDYAQLRYSGPFWNQYSPKDYLLRIELNILISCIKDDRDNHKIFRMTGIFEKALESSIPVYKYGTDSVIDTRAYIGCLERVLNGSEEITTHHWGQVDPSIRILQSTIESHYKIDIRLA